MVRPYSSVLVQPFSRQYRLVQLFLVPSVQTAEPVVDDWVYERLLEAIDGDRVQLRLTDRGRHFEVSNGPTDPMTVEVPVDMVDELVPERTPFHVSGEQRFFLHRDPGGSGPLDALYDRPDTVC